MTWRVLAAATTVAAALSAGTAATAAQSVESCEARPVVEQFFAALAAGDLDRLDELFAAESEGWTWYSISDLVGQRLGPASMRRSSLRAYFAARIARHERFRLVQIDENGSGNFG